MLILCNVKYHPFFGAGEWRHAHLDPNPANIYILNFGRVSSVIDYNGTTSVSKCKHVHIYRIGDFDRLAADFSLTRD